MNDSYDKPKPPPPAAPAATIITDDNDTIMQAADEQRKRLKRSGYTGSMLAGSGLGNPQTEKKTLLG